ncbi:PDR/VanB family oxidoreductase [Komagataeibacter europaeus]|uniref:PDR/VanB family oxidoreductase n=1 Tax=Komagataeibacter europaeus TaxID=33995 RepID=UPI000B3E8339|nr:PDR/VanB family oxidoreductase [Komagataeibacter europaeus]ARW15915.1 Vanillate monooxygenase [Komagataeibacter europaeus]
MDSISGYHATLSSIDVLSPDLRRFVISAREGAFPAISPGSNGVFAFGNKDRIWKNAYSIVERSDDGRSLHIIVRRAAPSRGGSRFLYEHGKVGLDISVTGLSNRFPIVKTAQRHILVSAGIGITPFLSYMNMMQKNGMDFSLHHYVRPAEKSAFKALLSSYDPSKIIFHEGRDGAVGTLHTILANEPVTSHLYVCGPDSFMEWVRETATDVGYVPSKIHYERFVSPSGGRVFDVVLARSGKTITVQAEETLLEALEGAGIQAPCMCRGGACGMCRVAVLEGEAEHRDHVLTEGEREEGKAILTCVSRARSRFLKLDL